MAFKHTVRGLDVAVGGPTEVERGVATTEEVEGVVDGLIMAGYRLITVDHCIVFDVAVPAKPPMTPDAIESYVGRSWIGGPLNTGNVYEELRRMLHWPGMRRVRQVKRNLALLTEALGGDHPVTARCRADLVSAEMNDYDLFADKDGREGEVWHNAFGPAGGPEWKQRTVTAQPVPVRETVRRDVPVAAVRKETVKVVREKAVKVVKAAREVPAYNANGIPGAVGSRRFRETGLEYALVHVAQAGLDTSKGTYAVLCVTHREAHYGTSRATAWPTGLGVTWCPDCARLVEAGVKPAAKPATAAAPPPPAVEPAPVVERAPEPAAEPESEPEPVVEYPPLEIVRERDDEGDTDGAPEPEPEPVEASDPEQAVALCKNGHPQTPENVSARADGRRTCKVCHREAVRRSRAG